MRIAARRRIQGRNIHDCLPNGVVIIMLRKVKVRGGKLKGVEWIVCRI